MILRNKTSILFTVSLVFLLLSGSVESLAGGGTGPYISQQDGDWVVSTTWTNSTAGLCRVDDPYTISPGDSVWATCDPLETTANGTINVEGGGVLHVLGAGGLTGNGDITVNPGGNLIVDGNFDITGSGDLVLDGDMYIGGDLTIGGSGVAYGTGNIVIQGVGCQYWTGSGTCIDANSVLPVLMISVSVSSLDGDPQVHWTSVLEKDNEVFVIERSEDAVNYEEVGRVKPREHSTDINKYEFLDKGSGSRNWYYRVKQIDTDGTIKYSRTVHYIANMLEQDGVLIYPNPSKGKVFVELMEKNLTDIVQITILDAYGKQVHQDMLTYTGPVSVLENSDLPPGVYIMNLRGTNVNATRRFVIN